MICIKQPVDNSASMEKKKKSPFDPSSGNQPSAKGNQTPDIKLNLNRPLPSNTGDYDPWGKGAGNPSRDETGNTVRKSNTLDSTRVNSSHLHECIFVCTCILSCKNVCFYSYFLKGYRFDYHVTKRFSTPLT